MTVTLQDPVLLRDPASRHAFPEMRPPPRLGALRTLREAILAGFADGEEPLADRRSKGAGS